MNIKRLLYRLLCLLYSLLGIRRGMIKFIHDRNCQDMTGVEIGVFRGTSAYSILSSLSIKKLYLIDPYLKYGDYNEEWINKDFSKKSQHSQQEFDNDQKIAQKKIKCFKDKIRFIRMKSADAVSQIPNNLDFCYIDGNHAHEYVKQDIQLYFQKLKTGGIIGGDNLKNESGVHIAVFDFIGKMHLKLYKDANEWWVIKTDK